MQHAVHATNVFHYDHVALALWESGYATSVMTRFEVDPAVIRRLDRSPLVGHKIAALAQRRQAPSLSEDIDRYWGSWTSLLYPLAARSHWGALSPPVVRAVGLREGAKAARLAQSSTLYHFIEGLGARAITGNRAPRYTVCERRNVHYKTLEQDLEIAGDFPFGGPERNPLTDVFDTEYELASRILVYSQAARQSFVQRGIDPSRVKSIPLPFVPRPNVSSRVQRDPFLFSYVGRSDAYKGIDVAVEAVARLGPPFRLDIAGPLSRAVQDWLTTKKHVRYLGILHAQELDLLYARCRALLMPSIESFGLAVLEAASQGAKVVCRETTGAREYLYPNQYVEVCGRSVDTWSEVLAAIATQEDQEQSSILSDRLDRRNVVRELCNLYASLEDSV